MCMIQIAKNRIEELESALKDMTEWFEHEDHTHGYCCCGMRMDTHEKPMDSGHVPTDAGVYHAGLLIDAARKALSNASS